jgi:hypothetical protein
MIERQQGEIEAKDAAVGEVIYIADMFKNGGCRVGGLINAIEVLVATTTKMEDGNDEK